MYDLADSVPLTINITDDTGNPARATSVSVTVTLPNGTTSAPAVSTPVLGQYQADYFPTMPGRHGVQWIATGANSSGFSDTFDVRAAVPPYIVSLVDTKQYLNILTTTNDEELRGFIEAATDVVEDVVGPVVVRTITETHPRPGRVLVLQQPPVVSLTSLTSVLTGGWNYDITTVDVDPQSGILRRLDGLPLGPARPFPLRVIYQAGRPVIPASITMATKVIIDHLWETQRGHTQGVRPQPGGGKGAGKKPPVPLPSRALELLRPYRRSIPVF